MCLATGIEGAWSKLRMRGPLALIWGSGLCPHRRHLKIRPSEIENEDDLSMFIMVSIIIANNLLTVMEEHSYQIHTA